MEASDLGGIRGRTLRFHTGTGEVLLQRLRRLPGAAGGETGIARGRKKEESNPMTRETNPCS